MRRKALFRIFFMFLCMVIVPISIVNAEECEVTIDVPADSSYTIDYDISKGDRILISASGQWCVNKRTLDTCWYGPDGCNDCYSYQAAHPNFYCNNLDPYSLIGQINNGECFQVGSSYSGIADQLGKLTLRMNDEVSDTPYGYHDNLGSLWVTVHITPTPTPENPSLILTKSATPSTIQESETTTITIKTENTGSADAKNIAVMDSIPDEFTLVSGSIDQSYDILKPNEYRTYQYTIKATETGRFVADAASTTYEDEKDNSYSSASNPVIITVEHIATPIPTVFPESEGPLKVDIECPSRVDPGEEFEIIVKIKNPSKSAYGWYTIFKKEDVKNINILSENIQITDQPKIYPDYVGSDFYEKWENHTLPKNVIVEGGKALILKKIDPLFVFGLLTGTPTDPPGIVAILAEWPIEKEIKRSTTFFVIWTCEKEGIQKGIPIPPFTNLIINITAKAPSTEGVYQIASSIPYEYTSTKVGGFGRGGMQNEWYSVKLSSGQAVGFGTINVKKSIISIPEILGFEAVLGIVGLLAVVYIFKRNKDR